MRILITGASGFVGGAVGEILAADGFEIIRAGGKSDKKPFAGAGGEIRFRFDIAVEREVSELANLQNIAAVVHSAGLAHRSGENLRGEFYRVNVEGTKNAVKLTARLNAERFILISSAAVYGGGEDAKTEADLCQPNGDYAESKLAAEQAAAALCREYKLKLTILRLAAVIGEADRANYFRLITAVDRRRYIQIGRGTHRKSTIYKDDVGRACRQILKHSRADYEVFNLSAEPLEIREIVGLIGRTLGRKIFPLAIPARLVKITERLNDGVLGFAAIKRLTQTARKLLTDDVLDTRLIKKTYGFAPEISAREAVRRECVWYKNVI